MLFHQLDNLADAFDIEDILWLSAFAHVDSSFSKRCGVGSPSIELSPIPAKRNLNLGLVLQDDPTIIEALWQAT